MNGRPSIRFLPLCALLFAAPARAADGNDDALRAGLDASRAAAADGRAAAEAAGRDGREDRASAAGLRFGRCALGTAADCLRVLKCGLAPEDRAGVRLSPSGAVLVDADRAGASANLAALRRIAGSPDAVRVEVLAPADHYALRTVTTYPAGAPQAMSSRMGHPDTSDGFLGYTFPPYRGRVEDGIMYSPGDWTAVVVNAKQKDSGVAETIFHEFRHVLLGDFGRAALKAKHGLADVERETKAAEDEARRNAAQCP